MEVNRDEAERCIDIATAALTNDQPEKAQRFLEKAQRLFPTEKAKGELKWPFRSKGGASRARYAEAAASMLLSSLAASPASRMSSAARAAGACDKLMHNNQLTACYNDVIARQIQLLYLYNITYAPTQREAD